MSLYFLALFSQYYFNFCGNVWMCDINGFVISRDPSAYVIHRRKLPWQVCLLVLQAPSLLLHQRLCNGYTCLRDYLSAVGWPWQGQIFFNLLLQYVSAILAHNLSDMSIYSLVKKFLRLFPQRKHNKSNKLYNSATRQ